MKFGEMDPMHVPANPSGIPQPNPYEQEGPDECVVCGEPAQQHSAWCRSCAAALEEDRMNRETYR